MLRYIHGTVGFELKYNSSGGVTLLGYTNSEEVGSIVDRKSTSGYCFSMVSTMISWSSKNKGFVALSTTEDKYIATSDVGQEATWLRKLLVGLFSEVLETTIIHCENQRFINLSNNPVFRDRSKHIDMRYHYIRDMVQKGVVRLQYILTNE